MRQITKEPEFKKEWSWIETEGVEQVVSKWLECCGINKSSTEFFGMPYTSTSDYAMAGNTNSPKGYRLIVENGEFKNLHLSHFALTTHSCPMLVIVYEDEDGYFHYYELESDDFIE